MKKEFNELVNSVPTREAFAKKETEKAELGIIRREKESEASNYISCGIEKTTMWWISFTCIHLADTFVHNDRQIEYNSSYSASTRSMSG